MANFIPLDNLGVVPSGGTSGMTSKSRGCSAAACGSAATDLQAAVWNRIKDHPCYSEEAHHYFARMHAAVAPACNIQCNYCNRKYDCANESRPGVVSERLTPDHAVRKVIAVANQVPQLSVLGIAGPGDACYDWERTKATFTLVAKEVPDLKFCISTNGLALPDHIDELAALNIDHVTITINMVDPMIGTRIYPWIYFDHRRHTGLVASQILHERQMLSLELLRERGILVKVNSVMIPGVNDAHLPLVNAEVKKRGAFLHNIMPLISDPAHGTAFGLAGQRGPTHAELKALQDACGGARLMRHCRQCRADAVGLLSQDRGQDFTSDKLPGEIAYEASKRVAYREFVAGERRDYAAAKQAAADTLAEVAGDARVLVAVLTGGGGRVNVHFGKAREFQIYEASPTGVRFVGVRRIDETYCQGECGHGEAGRLKAALAALDGVQAVLCARIGTCPKRELAAAAIMVSDEWAYEYIETAVSAYYARTYGVGEWAFSA